MKKIVLIILTLFFPFTCLAENYYILQGGSGDGSSWSSAWDDLPATLTRGDTYYVGDGSYNGYTFDDAVSGTTLITIKKATSSDHGTEIGWSSAYGDGQATFGKLTWTTHYWIFDGQTRNSNDWSDGTAYGFEVDGGSGGNNAKLFSVSSADNITIQYVYAHYDGSRAWATSGDDVSANRDHGLYSLSGSNDITMEYCYIRYTTWKAAILMNSCTGPITIRYNYFEDIRKKELFSARHTDNVTFAFNMSKNIAGTGALVADDSDTWKVYGNWIWNPSGSYTFTDVTIGTWTGDHPDRNETLNDWLVYNNTFYNVHDQIQIQNGTGNEVRNNLILNESISINGSLTASHNTQNASVSVVNGAGSGDFTLSAATDAGTTLSSPYNVDLTGATRGGDGTWDRGAYEYDASALDLQIDGVSID
jgi:hypothetical protein